ncbi:MAG: type IX secretion system membrane protein PorP/SprF [Hymenobacteraceae bacterium]|nr:type IX secretion system membrane protein PorP/SprF [Hymenobacteraceae bacterium]MDX5397969.1 type IX secretion system membrane protein PorP/SprF [Hymenobacteraceae bacterium]MDX5514041.1 type IX secretion system membrane protein PorP/SprF [Hymenobacteraceae bacterium]
MKKDQQKIKALFLARFSGKCLKNAAVVTLMLCGGLSAKQAQAQQQPQYTQYIFNGLVLNPAYAGTKEQTQANVLHRSQWAGLEGAPTTQTLFVDGAVKENRIGLGFQAMHDRIGAQGQLSAHASVAVRIRMGEQAKLSFGMAGGIVQYSLDGTKLVIGAPDPSIPQTKETTIMPDAKAGLFFHTDRFYAGLSAANLFRFKNNLLVTPQRHYFLTSGYVFDLGESLKLKPSFLLKEDFNGPTNLDLNTFILVKERIWLGASYRTGIDIFEKDFSENVQNSNERNTWAFATELYVTPQFRLGYAYDLTLGSLNNYAGHEVSAGYTFLKKQDSRMLSPRYF